MDETAEILSIIALLVHNNNSCINQILALGATAVLEKKDHKPKSRYLRNGTLGNPGNSTWKRTDVLGDDKEFLHFTAFTREAFDPLVGSCTDGIEKYPIRKKCNSPQRRHLTRRHNKPRDIVAMTIKYLTSKAELKDLSVQFGAHESTFIQCVHLGMWCIIEALADHENGRVYWDRSPEAMENAANVTKEFLDCPNR